MPDNLYLLIAGAMLGIFFIVSLLLLLQMKTQNKVLRQKRLLAETEIQHQRALTSVLITSQEQERKRIGMDLHDEVGTALSALRLRLEQIKSDQAVPAGEDVLHANVFGSIDHIIYNVRRISHNLSPFTKGVYELKEALEDMAEQIAGSGHMAVKIDFDTIEDFGFVPEAAQLSVYRIIAELMNNTIKHAKASRIEICFAKDDRHMHLGYKDNGLGIADVHQGRSGMGMANIESRCHAMHASCQINANSTNGFGIDIKIPLNV